jgi:hypothetical protein
MREAAAIGWRGTTKYCFVCQLCQTSWLEKKPRPSVPASSSVGQRWSA